MCVYVCMCVRERERVREMQNKVIEFISLLLTMSANCPEMLFSKGMTGALAPFSYLVFI